MALLISINESILSPKPGTPTITGVTPDPGPDPEPPVDPVITSDAFERTGALQSSVTDNYLGGQPKTWGGTNGAANTTAEGQLTLATQGVFSQCVDAGTTDVELSFRLVQGPVTVSGFHSMVDLRKETAGTGNVLRMVLHSYDAGTGITKAQLCKRVGGTGTLLGEVFDIEDSQVIRISIKGDQFKAYVNGVLKQTVTDNSVPTGTFFGFSGSSSNRTWKLSEFVLKAI